MKIPFTNKEILTMQVDRDRFLRTIGNHTDADNKTFERIFVGQVDNNGFQVVRVKKFGLWDYCVTSLSGHIVNNKDKIELHLTYKLRWWYALELPVVLLFFGMFITFAAVSDNTNTDTNDILIIGGMGLVAITWTILRYRRRFRTDKEKYRSILDQLIVRSDIRQ